MLVTVLVMMQDAPFRESLKEKLQRRTMSVFTADDARQMMRIFAEHDIDVVLFDIRGQGRQAMRNLADVKRAGNGAEVVLLSSARAEDVALSMQGMRQGAFDDVAEPFELEAIIQKIYKGRERKRARLGLKKKRSLRSYFQDTMIAAAFAQAGEYDTAQEWTSEDTMGRGDRTSRNHRKKGDRA
jgi:DNA-binding NtrC family response regulator